VIAAWRAVAGRGAPHRGSHLDLGSRRRSDAGAMMHEVRSIPPAPRRVRLRPLLAHRWPLLVLGVGLGIVGGLWTWMLFLAAGAKPSDQRLLDDGPTAVATGTVLRAEPPLTWDGRPWERVHYEFPWHDGTPIPGASFAPLGTCAVGARVTVEYLPHLPNRNRVVGTLLHFPRAWLQPSTWFAGVVVPGALLLLGWLAGVFQLRQVLVHGDVSVGTMQSLRLVRGVVPEMLRVVYEFRDHHAVLRRGRHWVRAHGPLGQRLARQMDTGWLEPMPVLHDRRLPQWNRMLLPGAFLPWSPGDVPQMPVTT
jgi:hypothetical protein